MGTRVRETPRRRQVELAPGATVIARMPSGKERRSLQLDEGVPVLEVRDPQGDIAGAARGGQAERIADLQGRRAYLLNQGDLLVVDGFHSGQLSVWLSAPTGDLRQRPPKPGSRKQELVRIAKSVRWGA